MTAGITVYNSSGFLQVDSEWPNLEYFGTYSAATTSTLLDTSYGYLDVSGLPDVPVVAVKGTGNGTTARVASWNSVTGTARITFSAKGASGTTVAFLVFSRPLEGHHPTNGFEVRDASGLLCFSASGKFLRIAANTSSVPSVGAVDTLVATLDASKTYACMFFQDGFNQRAVNQAAGGSTIADWWVYSFRAFSSSRIAPLHLVGQLRRDALWEYGGSARILPGSDLFRRRHQLLLTLRGGPAPATG